MPFFTTIYEVINLVLSTHADFVADKVDKFDV